MFTWSFYCLSNLKLALNENYLQEGKKKNLLLALSNSNNCFFEKSLAAQFEK